MPNETPNILVVEDDMDGQEVVTRILKHHRVNYDIAQSGEDALVKILHQPYTAVIIDLSLPGMDGWTLLRNIRDTGYISQLPCVAITAYHSAEVAVKAIEYGFNSYFPKPIEATSFVRELMRVIS